MESALSTPIKMTQLLAVMSILTARKMVGITLSLGLIAKSRLHFISKGMMSRPVTGSNTFIAVITVFELGRLFHMFDQGAF